MMRISKNPLLMAMKIATKSRDFVHKLNFFLYFLFNFFADFKSPACQ